MEYFFVITVALPLSDAERRVTLTGSFMVGPRATERAAYDQVITLVKSRLGLAEDVTPTVMFYRLTRNEFA